ncbi:MAG: GTPase HflX [Candidatus Anoxymicrobium japonicum]|uniref:GTPase HflX n=1 Tax=Candidatus Anoxymicrobium japonicum TaxID=2013648 RepID=A0A2N3G8J3_9ACTN|nr:MAG: GTPase HflX [Candidatus Anoxymicrobium japonicum]
MSSDNSPNLSGDVEGALLVALQLPSMSDDGVAESLSELEALAVAAGARIRGSLTQKRDRYDPATVLGRGKVEEVARAVRDADASLVIFDNELSVAQQGRLASALGVRVLDRAALILDIFALHAHTAEGRTQVELAQLSYLFPRMRGHGIELSRLGGGIGTRGPGETKLEVDRRRIRKRMRRLERDLEKMEAVRQTQCKQRGRAGLISICLVGYTNSGKSSILNRLTGSTVLVRNQLFSTLDSTTRRLEFARGQAAVISDTVGFIRNLPHELVAAFHSTLEVVRDAMVLIHVIDATMQESMASRMRAVIETLAELDASDIPAITVFNKTDAVSPTEKSTLKKRFPESVLISALTGEGTPELLSAIAAVARLELSSARLRVPADRGDIIASLYRDATVQSSRIDGDSMLISARLPRDKLANYSTYLEKDSR